VKTKLGKPDKVKVIVSIPYPSSKLEDFGDPLSEGKTLNFADPQNGSQNRIKAVKWYIDEVNRRFKTADYKHLELVGFYWFDEATDFDNRQIIKGAADEIHKRGQRFFWIPYFAAMGYRDWKDLGFDVAMMQPNESFQETPVEQAGIRLETAAKMSKQYGLGMEMETAYDLNNPVVRGKYLAYLEWGRKLGYMNDSVISYFQSMDVFLQAARSDKPEVRNIYDETHRLSKGSLDRRL
jgi:hypothetical protein